jgi:hypothetical protein
MLFSSSRSRHGDLLRSAGADVTVSFENAGHGLTNATVDLVRRWLTTERFYFGGFAARSIRTDSTDSLLSESTLCLLIDKGDGDVFQNVPPHAS